ncbi:MAG: hypothetical protein R2762_26820 [Bryobacteraceae bacterium]
MTPFDPTAVAYLYGLGLAYNALGAIASVPGGIPTELTGGFLGDFLKKRLGLLRERLDQGHPGANHDLYKALTDSFWLAILHSAAAYGDAIGEPLTAFDKLGLPAWMGDTWSAMRAVRRGKTPPGEARDREILRALYPKLIAPLQASEPSKAAEIDAIYAEAERLLDRSPTLTDARDALRAHAERALGELVLPHYIPAPLSADLRDRFDELYRAAFAERIKKKPEVRDIFLATITAETHAMVRALGETLARIAADTGELKSQLSEMSASDAAHAALVAEMAARIDRSAEERTQAMLAAFADLGSGVDAVSAKVDAVSAKVDAFSAREDRAHASTRADLADLLGFLEALREATRDDAAQLAASIAGLHRKVEESNRGARSDAADLFAEIQDLKALLHGRTTATAIPPTQPANCYGREHDLSTLRGLLLGASADAAPVLVCSVQGLPGVGKSLLVETFAWLHWRDHFPGGYVSLKLDPNEAPNAVQYLERLAHALAIRETASSALAGLAAQRLRDPRTLLHIENVDSDEQAGAAAKLIADLAGVPIVISSRVRELGRNRGWRTLELEPVDEDAALRILGEYGVEKNADAGKLVWRLGYLPLAIRLVGGAIEEGTHTVKSLLGEAALLDLASSDPTEEDRRRQLRACFDISLRAFEQALARTANGAKGPANGLVPLRDFGTLPLEGAGVGLAAVWCGLEEPAFHRYFALARRLSLVIEERKGGSGAASSNPQPAVDPEPEPVRFARITQERKGRSGEASSNQELVVDPEPERVRFARSDKEKRWRAHPLLAEYLRGGGGSSGGGRFRALLASHSVVCGALAGGDGQRERWDEVDAEPAALEAWLGSVPEESIPAVREGHGLCDPSRTVPPLDAFLRAWAGW